MSRTRATGGGPWSGGDLPANVRVGADTLITGESAFTRFFTERDPGLTIGDGCTMEGVQFALGKDAVVSIGDSCYFTNAVLLAELELRFGDRVVMGWNTTIADTDFHPIDPAARIVDAIASSAIGKGTPRPPITRRAVVVEDDVWIGPAVTILKGVTIGSGSFIEPGSLVTSDVPVRSRVLGNPGTVVGTV